MALSLYIDGDAFPNLLKPVVIRAIERCKLETHVISNGRVNIGHSDFISYEIVSDGPDAADNKIVELVLENDLVITSDIPLADRVITKGAHVINHHGKYFDEDNVKQALAIRDLMSDIRDSGEMTKGSAPIGEKNKREFANALNQFLNRHYKQ